MSPEHKPPYVDPAGDPGGGGLPAAPPFVFRAVTSRVFPLKANMAGLSAFWPRGVRLAQGRGIRGYHVKQAL
jgi:hypothetical protein